MYRGKKSYAIHNATGQTVKGMQKEKKLFLNQKKVNATLTEKHLHIPA